ncbi:MAG: cupin domain-containing protein [Pigmentiphaga sp.]|uniref:cupin domain-containing protein n=1 Tax=Pigmentiphaga sp. TaxID=1977564 RepID=UPI0029A57B0D|nr:cupin domain-containing protein [Pigmentiphaga sp.]MDX3906830.1 cupin domain-containing protein [Pigmentiphaga sp.]
MNQVLTLKDALSRVPEDLEWGVLRPGVGVAWIYRDPDGGPSAAYLRYEPGASVPLHHHPGLEHILVLEGEQQDERGVYPAGTLVVNPPGTRHSVQSPKGCLALLIWNRPVEILDPAEAA